MIYITRWKSTIVWATGVTWGPGVDTTLETRIFALLSNSSAIKLKVDTRVYPLVMPQDVQLPAVSYQRQEGTKINHLRGYSGLENVHMSVFSWASNYADAKALAAELHTVMLSSNTFKALLLDDMDFYDSEINIYGVSQNFSCWNQE